MNLIVFDLNSTRYFLMLLNRIKKITGVLKIRILTPDFETKTFDQNHIYMGGICLETNLTKCICTNYVAGVIDAQFVTYKELSLQLGLREITQETLEKLDWSNSHKLNIFNMSKQWDYINFSLDSNDRLKVDLISFPKINKIAGVFSLEKKYSIYGSTNCQIPINKTIKTNLIHDELAPQIFYCGGQTDTYSGTVVYTVCEIEGAFVLEILGYTSNDYDGETRIVPIQYCENLDTILSTQTVGYTPTLLDLTEIPIVKATVYPQFTKNFSTNIKKDDIVISANGKNILEMEIFDTYFNQKISLDEYLTYLSQFQPMCSLILIRKGKIIEVFVNIQIFKFELVNPIYMDIHNLYVRGDEIKFSTDICDAMLQYDIFDKQIIKYMNDITYSIEKISV